MKAVASHYYVIVIEDMATKNIAAAGTILVEHKFVHQNGLVGHIEDIIVNEQYRGKNFGKWQVLVAGKGRMRRSSVCSSWLEMVAFVFF